MMSSNACWKPSSRVFNMATVTEPQGEPPSSVEQPAASIDPLALMRIKNLSLRAKVLVEGFYNGLHRSPFHGSSVEFREYRPYATGDDLRNLDWKLYARSDRYYIKKFDDETNRQCFLVLDQSRSMGFGSLEYTKIEYAQTLTATLAYFLTLQRDSVGLLTFDEIVHEFIPASRTRGQLRRLMVALARPVAGQGTDLEQPLKEIAALVRRRGLIIIASDFLANTDALRRNFAYLRSRGHQVLALQVLDPAEKELGIQAPSVVVDMETDREVYIDPIAAGASYSKAMDQHQEELRSICNSLGVDFRQHLTDQPIESALFELVSAQQSRPSHGVRPQTVAAGGGTDANRLGTSGSETAPGKLVEATGKLETGTGESETRGPKA